MTVTETTTEVAAPAAAPMPTTTASTPTDVTPGARRNKRPGLNTETLALGAIFIALFSFAAAIFAVGLASRAIDEHEAVLAAGSAGGGVASAAATVDVSLTEFAITPGPITTTAGATLNVVNDGAVPHSLSVEGLVTPDLAAGEIASLDISSLAPGTYTVICAIVGHKEAGMETTLTIT